MILIIIFAKQRQICRENHKKNKENFKKIRKLSNRDDPEKKCFERKTITNFYLNDVKFFLFYSIEKILLLQVLCP